MSWLRPALLIARKDLRLELRTRDVIGSAGLFALLVMVTASFAFPTWGRGREAVAAGVLWMAFIFAALLGLARSFAAEKEEGCLDGLLLSPAPPEAIFLGKLLATLAFTWSVQLAILPVFVVLLQLEPGWRLGLLAATALLGALGLVTVGTLFAAIAVSTRGRESTLPLLVMPVAVPVMIASVKLSETALRGTGELTNWLLLLVGYDALFLLVGLVAFPYVTEG